ncbi:hypothetical protein KAR29_00365 [Aminithiophilus ramosus]|uniref:Uncharacterized protein n=2 Tax=Synergistales TaxID=649776 RepID=A0A9Q7EXG2_9BACT|nr:DUF364 domain-containing protein [Aminithiophilus ramosus]QTX32440.1 hypothetical protein KAR29_00365 [Aminithiophilus ramosus]QVL36317.1 hypothetical protein KIH16_00365 [Synergistota bacterium]
MRLFEALVAEVERERNGVVERLLLGWHGAAVVLDDGRAGFARVPLPGTGPRESHRGHTAALLGGSAHDLVRLLVSPYPQEFSLAGAAAEALLPPPPGPGPEALRLLVRDGRASVVGYDPDLVLLFRSWRWDLSIFDDVRRAPDVYPSWTEGHLLQGAPWVFLSSEALRDRRVLSLAPHFRKSEGTVLVGPGLPWTPRHYRELGISHLLSPRLVGTSDEAASFLGAGGGFWECPALEWQLTAIPLTETVATDGKGVTDRWTGSLFG